MARWRLWLILFFLAWHWISLANDLLVLRQYSLLDHVARFSVDRISKLPMAAVSLLFGGHRDGQSRGAFDDSDFPDHKTEVVRFEHV
jgi:hypothetical protein